MGVHEDRGDLKKGGEQILNSTDIGRFSNLEGCCLCNEALLRTADDAAT
jgi:hypothetical protein